MINSESDFSSKLMSHGVGLSPLRGLAVSRIPSMRRKRYSSYDRSGGNQDFQFIPKGKWTTIAEINGPAIINHIWMTYGTTQEFAGRMIAIRIYWDDDDKPAVEAPLGDFYGLGHGLVANYSCAVLSASPENGRGLNCWFPMPFRSKMRVEILQETDKEKMALYYYFDYEDYSESEDSLPDEFLYFHAHWRRENPCDGWSKEKMETTTARELLMEGKNPTGDGNYSILDIKGRGHYVGCSLHVTNLRFTGSMNWWGEGDDMIFVDGEPWPPEIHGTGSEDYFNTAYSPRQEVREPYHGIVFGGERNWAGRISFYRYHVEDPVPFLKSIRVTIEHGHDNRRSDDYSSTAYWYSDSTSHPELPGLPSLKDRMPVELMKLDG